ncbi:MAG: acyl-CoA dehydrogenase family protein [Planctomycetes bacterium]|nr:acyl-CoA dehydrogenase family protein [Planctomycetota bacterium]
MSAPITGDAFSACLDDSHHAFREVCARFAREEIAPHAQAWEEAETFPRELYLKAAEAGVLGPGLPEEYGGGGGDLFHMVVSTEELLRGGSTGVVVGLGSLEIALPPIMVLGTEEQRQRYLPPVLAGEKISALAITEPGAGSDVSGVTTRATREGDHYRLTGTKIFVTSGVRADQLTLLARTSDDPHGGLTFFVVPGDSEGLTVSRAIKKTGWRASDTAELSLDGVRVPVSARLGEEGTGFLCLMQTFLRERMYLAAIGTATAEVCYEDAATYVKQRETFGRPIVKHQVVRHRLADMAGRVLAAKALVYHTVGRALRDEATPPEVALTKNQAADCAEWVCREAVQLLGGMGYCRETRAEVLSRDARLLNIGGGTREIMNEIAGRAFL